MAEQIVVGVVVAVAAALIAALFAAVRVVVRLFWRMDHLEGSVSRLDTKLEVLASDLREHMAAEAEDVAELKQLIRETRHEPCRP
jgi:hypothetical protein